MKPRPVRVGAAPGALDRVLDRLGLPARPTTLVVNGGTSDDSDFPAEALTAALGAAVDALADCPGPVIVSGGTDAGLFALLGQALAGRRFAGPVIGVVPAGMVDPPDGTRLEPHHSHTVLVTGNAWGDETPTMLALSAELDRRGPIAVLLAGGGRIAARELEGHRRARRPVIALTGTGRLADEVGSRDPLPSGVSTVAVDDPAGLARVLGSLLSR